MSEAPDFGLHRDFYTFDPESLAQQLPAFAIGREVGKGSMGVVYEATVRRTGQRVALKILPPSLTLTEHTLARFLREGRIMARVHHPDITAFVDQGSTGRLHWFAMEFVDGVSLEERLHIGPLPVRKACRIAATVARALQFAHEHGVVHRDVKPGNVILRDGPAGQPRDPEHPRVAITDFGLARETGTGSMTDSGALVGTPMYMAPEVVLGGSQVAGTLADVYSLGATLYTLVTGRPPFDGPTAQSVLKAVLERDPTSPRRLRHDLPEPVEAMLCKAMARKPAQRYGSAEEFATDLERFLRGERTLARTPGLVRRTGRWCARRPLVTGLLAAVVLSSGSAASLLHHSRRSAVERDLASAERHLAIAATERDEFDRPRTVDERRDELHATLELVDGVLAREPRHHDALLVRARALQRLHRPAEALADLDQAEALAGGPTVALLQQRAEVLRALGDAGAQRRLLQDLTSLLRLDPSPHTRALIAEQLLDYAAQADGAERRAALERASVVLGEPDDSDPRTAVAHARLLELQGQVDAAIASMRAIRERHEGNLFVHLQAAAMFDRHDLVDEGAREHEEVLRLRGPGSPPATGGAPVDVGGFGAFLGDVDRVLRALDDPPAPEQAPTGPPAKPPTEPAAGASEPR